MKSRFIDRRPENARASAYSGAKTAYTMPSRRLDRLLSLNKKALRLLLLASVG